MADKEIKETSAASVSESKKADGKKSVSKPKNAKPSLGARIARSWREYKSELKKIVWYSREQTIRSSILVVVSILVVGAVISGLDFAFSHFLTWLARLV